MTIGSRVSILQGGQFFYVPIGKWRSRYNSAALWNSLLMINQYQSECATAWSIITMHAQWFPQYNVFTMMAQRRRKLIRDVACDSYPLL